MSAVGLEVPGARAKTRAAAIVDSATALLDDGWRKLYRAAKAAAKTSGKPPASEVLEQYRRYFSWYQDIRMMDQYGLTERLLAEAPRLAEWAETYERLRAANADSLGPMDAAKVPAPAPELVPPPTKGDGVDGWLDTLAQSAGRAAGSVTLGASAFLLGAGALALFFLVRGQRA